MASAERSLVFRALEINVIEGRADDVALTDAGGSTTYARLLHDSASIAGALRQLGVDADGVVAIDLPEGRHLVMALLACARLGARIGSTGTFRFAGDPVVLSTPDTDVEWDVLLRAGRTDPAGAPDADPTGYAEQLLADHGHVFGPLLDGGTVAW